LDCALVWSAVVRYWDEIGRFTSQLEDIRVDPKLVEQNRGWTSTSEVARVNPNIIKQSATKPNLQTFNKSSSQSRHRKIDFFFVFSSNAKTFFFLQLSSSHSQFRHGSLNDYCCEIENLCTHF
jgi:hypothetical protein